MLADTLEELHAMAEEIGLKRAWFQAHPLHPHYDLTEAKRTAALAAGAVFVPAKEQAARRLKEHGHKATTLETTMKKTTLTLLTLLLCACGDMTTEPTASEWLPLACDVEEVVTWTVRDGSDPNVLREIRNTRVRQVAILDADPADLDVRAFVAPDDPCATLSDCTVTSDTDVSPGGHYRLFNDASGLVTGIEGGGARVVCSTTDTSVVGLYATGQPYEEYSPPPLVYRRLQDAEYRTR